MKKEQVLKLIIRDAESLTKDEKEFLDISLDDFCEFVKVEIEDIAYYTGFSLEGLKLLKENGLEGDMLYAINDKDTYIRRKLESYCTHLTMKRLKRGRE